MATTTQPQRVPTVDDLRVKLCYICREEERYDNPEDPPRAWTHPCSCTLVAHESCLLQWIKAAQQDPAKVNNALKCPQCGATYELESENPRILRFLNALNAALSTAGKVVTVVGIVSLATSFGFTIYVVATSYGAFAVKEFLGEEMYNLLLTDEPSNWPWHAFIHLPIIPFSLILSRTRLFDSFPLVPLFLTWSSSPPVRTSSSSVASPSRWRSSTSTWPSGTSGPFTSPIAWPPTPFMAMVFLPFIRIAYRRLFDTLTKYVMGTLPESSARGAAGPIRRFIFALGDEGPAPLRVRIGADIQQANAQGAEAQQQGNGGDENVAAEAERTLRVTTSSLGRFIGGALLIPTISARMGSLLFRLSRHSSWLRAFLAIKDHPALPAPAIRLYDAPPGSNVGLMKQVGSGMVAGLHIMAGGTPTWNAADPVWWRNAVGLGLFVFAKDCVSLLHLYLTKRELESRRVKSRSFAGVDIRELDLIDSPLHPENASAGAGPGASSVPADATAP